MKIIEGRRSCSNWGSMTFKESHWNRSEHFLFSLVSWGLFFLGLRENKCENVMENCRKWRKIYVVLNGNGKHMLIHDNRSKEFYTWNFQIGVVNYPLTFLKWRSFVPLEFLKWHSFVSPELLKWRNFVPLEFFKMT